jgi:hypothetical protein
MGKTLRIKINSFDLGQLLAGLRIRAESWRKTADYLETGFSADDSFICEECDDAEEATKIADHYDRIIALIDRQVQEQGGWR